MTSCPPGDWTGEAIDRILDRIDRTAASVRPGFPEWADPDTGAWHSTADGRWTGGFWTGSLWLAYRATGSPRYLRWAREWLERLRPRLGLDNVLNGLVFYYGAALGALVAGDEAARRIAEEGARHLGRSFSPAAGLIPLGRDSGSITVAGEAETNVDGLPGASLLFWAAVAADDSPLREIARRHVSRHVELCVRDDGGVFQAAALDPVSGTVSRRFTPRGVGELSVWARAQAWAMLGFALAQRWAPETAFLEAATRTADWWLAHVPDDRVAFWDFDDPAIPSVERDTSATAIAAAALLELTEATERDGDRRRYREAAEATVRELVRRYLTPSGPDDRRPVGILTDGCWQKREGRAVRHELIWGDYFLLESLLRLAGRPAHSSKAQGSGGCPSRPSSAHRRTTDS